MCRNVDKSAHPSPFTQPERNQDGILPYRQQEGKSRHSEEYECVRQATGQMGEQVRKVCEGQKPKWKQEE